MSFMEYGPLKQLDCRSLVSAADSGRDLGVDVIMSVTAYLG